MQFSQFRASINVLDEKYTDLLIILTSYKDSIYGLGGNLKMIAYFLSQFSVPVDCLDPKCKSCSKRCDGFVHVARALTSVSRIHLGNHLTLLEEIMDFLQLQKDTIRSFKVFCNLF